MIIQNIMTGNTSDLEHPKPPLLLSIFSMKCPRCRRGPVFKHKNPYKKLSGNYMLDTYDDCVCCGQWYRIEPGFWLGTSYVSYGIMVFVSVVTFLLWWLFVGIWPEDWRLVGWLVFNSALIISLQPYVMRLSRIIFLYLIIKYDPKYDQRPPKRIL